MAQRQYQRAWRAGQLPGPAPVTSLPAADAPPLAYGAVVAAVKADLVGLPAGRARATERATALALAAVLDDSGALPQRAAAARVLVAVMAELRAGKAAHAGGTSSAAASFREFQRRKVDA